MWHTIIVIYFYVNHFLHRMHNLLLLQVSPDGRLHRLVPEWRNKIN